MFLACIDHLKREKGLGGFKPRRPTSHSQQAETPRQMAEAVRLRLDPATPVKTCRACTGVPESGQSYSLARPGQCGPGKAEDDCGIFLTR